ALRRTVCVMGPQQPCPTCMLRKQCAYPRIFETLIEPGEPVPRFLRGLPTGPQPYIFEPFDERRLYRPNESLSFDFILLGQAIELHPFAIFAVSQMAEQGLGFKRMPFRLEKVSWQKANGKDSAEEWRLLYDGATKRLLETPTPQLVNPDLPSISIKENWGELANGQTGKPRSSFLLNEETSGLTVNFVTSTRLKFNNDLAINFNFRMLVFKMIRRVLELAHFHVPGASMDWEFHDLLVAADVVKIVQHNLRWVDWERRSNRQKTEMMMGGFVGEMVLEGNLTPFEELLRICEVVHVGKGCVFGNGKMVCHIAS
ncbi:MAG: CRISPR system precrRNA processing endoribonuclease RAMP protein Cas6, partial [bacterium]